MTTLFRHATLADGRVRDVLVADGTIARVADADTVAVEDAAGDATAVDVVDCDGKHLLPGAIDAHVHFREPGFPHKEDWHTGSRSAAAGGVTTVVDQPNTDPPTVTGDAVDGKADRASRSLVDFGINGGVTADWDPDSLFDRPILALGEVFLADSTGDMGIEADLFGDAVARAAREDVTVTVHAEDADLFDRAALERAGDGTGRDADADAWSAYRTAEAEAAAVERALAVGADSDADVHIAHTSTPEGIDAASDAGATCEVTPHHLFLSREDLDGLGTFGRMNPPLRSEERREAVFERVADGTVDVVATDHAPHTRAEKDASVREAPSGVPGVETMLPLLLQEVREGALDLTRVRDLVAAAPARIFDVPGKGRVEEGADADLVLVDLDEAREIRGDDLHSKCGWTPFEGREAVFPELTLVRGHVAYDARGGDEAFGGAVGENVRRGS
ncbi:dihydroorotase [Halobaculum sp. CBA1158]|uniref:dihydroorotase n=1 Tax=Halobaculum sp. CBA1158 TaxID=2904243 RepID=UPI001F1B5FF4|nr:dihydroorotase [Halobaculum sp. CBA1158]UIO99734.1 dihydroorotase [Halobaculum sp. CBA1158]